MDLKAISIVFNPKGGSASQNAVDELVLEFTTRGIKVECHATTAEPGSAAGLARTAADSDADLVIACGGDGTARQVAEGLRGRNVPMAVFPLGTSNLFSKSFYSPPTAEQFAQMILNDGAKPQPVDMVRASYQDTAGEERQHLFMVGFGVGRVADAISTASPLFKRILGQLFYVLRVAIACLITDRRRFLLSVRGSRTSEVAAALFALNVVPPLMNQISRGCNASDGLMDVVIFRGRNAWGLICAAFWLALGRPERSRHYRRFRTNELSIACNTPMLPNIDGDPGVETREVKLTVEPGAVRMILS